MCRGDELRDGRFCQLMPMEQLATQSSDDKFAGRVLCQKPKPAVEQYENRAAPQVSSPEGPLCFSLSQAYRLTATGIASS